MDTKLDSPTINSQSLCCLNCSLMIESFSFFFWSALQLDCLLLLSVFRFPTRIVSLSPSMYGLRLLLYILPLNCSTRSELSPSAKGETWGSIAYVARMSSKSTQRLATWLSKGDISMVGANISKILNSKEWIHL